MTGLVVLGVLFGAILQITNATDINLAATGPVRHVVADFTAFSVIQRILVGGGVVLVGYVLIAMVGYIAVFWNFRLAGHGADTLRVTRGLLSIRATTISLSRLRGVEISEPLLLRAARGARCIAIATGLHVGRGAEREGSVLVPPAPRAVAQRVASAVLGLPEDICSGPLEPHGPAARRRRYTRALAGAVLVIAAICVRDLGSGRADLGLGRLVRAAAGQRADRGRPVPEPRPPARRRLAGDPDGEPGPPAQHHLGRRDHRLADPPDLVPAQAGPAHADRDDGGGAAALLGARCSCAGGAGARGGSDW